MNKVTWAIQSNLISDSQQKQVRDAAIKAGCEVQDILCYGRCNLGQWRHEDH